jgi:uncharacterized membrane protein YhiD involved in acid resistance
MLTLPPLELAGRLAMAVALAVFMGLAFEETYKSEERSRPGGIRTFPMLAMCGATLYLIEPAHLGRRAGRHRSHRQRLARVPGRQQGAVSVRREAVHGRRHVRPDGDALPHL